MQYLYLMKKLVRFCAVILAALACGLTLNASYTHAASLEDRLEGEWYLVEFHSPTNAWHVASGIYAQQFNFSRNSPQFFELVQHKIGLEKKQPDKAADLVTCKLAMTGRSALTPCSAEQLERHKLCNMSGITSKYVLRVHLENIELADASKDDKRCEAHLGKTRQYWALRDNLYEIPFSIDHRGDFIRQGQYRFKRAKPKPSRQHNYGLGPVFD
ncbi:MAG: hypothetical protein AB1540_16135 [Bdellovibrionota bacterium]